MNQMELIEGTNRDTSKSQYFTPAKLAQRVVEWAGVGFGVWNQNMNRQMRVLEPSAGNGALVRPLVAAGAEVTAIELDRRYGESLRVAGAQAIFCAADFLRCEGFAAKIVGDFDLCVMNPPYHENLAAEFTMHALKFAPRVVAIYQADIFYTVGRYEGLWTHARPTRAAMLARRPWPGETDYVVLEIVKRCDIVNTSEVSIEFWPDAWR